MSELLETVRKDILKAIDSDKLTLPTLPEVALKIRDAAQDPEATAITLSKVIGNDVALSARIIKVVNSPLYRASRPIENLQMAINRIGVAYTCNLATGLAMEQMFQATSDVIDQRMRAVWTRSTEVAAICHVLTKHYARWLPPDQATLAGLTYQIGVLPILRYAEDNDALVNDGITLDAVIQELHPIIGDKIFRKWSFPPELIDIPSQYLDFDRVVEKADLVDVVTVAHLQALVASGQSLAHIDLSKVKAFERLGLDYNIDVGQAEDLSEEMQAAAALFQ